MAEIRNEFDARSAELDEREAALPRLRRRIAEETRDEVRRECYAAERSAAKVQADEALRAYLERLRSQPIPLLVEEYLDRTDPSGRSYRRGFERFVDQRLAWFEAEHSVAGELELEPGDREQFIEDGGERLAIEVAQLQRQRGYGE